jgi:hypothetical protein
LRGHQSPHFPASGGKSDERFNAISCTKAGRSGRNLFAPVPFGTKASLLELAGDLFCGNFVCIPQAKWEQNPMVMGRSKMEAEENFEIRKEVT